jgi:VCBS repeat-containing protein
VNLDQFSMDIDAGNIRAIRDDLRQGGNGRLTDGQLLDADRGVWEAKGLGEYFPGNALFLTPTSGIPTLSIWDIPGAINVITAIFSGGTINSTNIGLNASYVLLGHRPEEFRGQPNVYDVWDHVEGPNLTSGTLSRYITVVERATGRIVLFFDTNPDLPKAVPNVEDGKGPLVAAHQIPDELTSDSEDHAYTVTLQPTSPGDPATIMQSTYFDDLIMLVHAVTGIAYADDYPNWLATFTTSTPGQQPNIILWARFRLDTFVGADFQRAPGARTPGSDPIFTTIIEDTTNVADINDRSGKISSKSDDPTLGWLNSANAPRWQHIVATDQITIDPSSGGKNEYGSSWEIDVIKDAAKASAGVLPGNKLDVLNLTTNGWDPTIGNKLTPAQEKEEYTDGLSFDVKFDVSVTGYQIPIRFGLDLNKVAKDLAALGSNLQAELNYVLNLGGLYSGEKAAIVETALLRQSAGVHWNGAYLGDVEYGFRNSIITAVLGMVSIDIPGVNRNDAHSAFYGIHDIQTMKGYNGVLHVKLSPQSVDELQVAQDTGTHVAGGVASIPDVQHAVDLIIANAESEWGITSDALAAAGVSAPSSVNVTTLTNSLLGVTTGSAIQIDDDANSNGWYVGQDLFSNDDFLPTSDPGVWVAKAGSAAEGRIDLLTVVLHEYGHILGLGDAGSDDGIMSLQLGPGVRRLPSAAVIAQVRALLAGKIAALAQAVSTGQSVVTIGIGDTPLPAAAPTPVIQQSQAQVEVNPAILSGDFQTGSGWSTTGTVEMADGTAILVEGSTTQTRLSQTFVVGSTDRFLRFTLNGVALQNGSGMPGDAFEVALLDLTSGASLGGAMSLSHTDAAINVQADGHEYVGGGVTWIVNADGSRTYLVDLRGIAAGTAVTLSFDLIGFGPADSHVSIRNVDMIGVPEAVDDSANGDEDGFLTGSVTANDVDAIGFPAILVNGSNHGAVTLSSDGHFVYTPDAGWFGTDTFSYLLDNGKATSNVATVTLTVVKVNHAPTSGDFTVALNEDGDARIDLLSHATDPDGDALTAHIVDGPLHGSIVTNSDGTLSYVPAPGFNGTDMFTYVANDGTTDSAVTTVTLEVAHVNHVPVSQDATVQSLEEQALNGSVLNWVSDRDGDTLSAELVGGPAHGTLTLNTDGSFTYRPDDLYRGTDSFSYRVSDGALTSTVATVTIVMAPVNHLPTVGDFAATVSEDGSVVLDPLTHATDVDGDVLAAAIVDGPRHGSLVKGADGKYTYLPDEFYAGTDRFTFTVNDGQGGSNVGTVTLTVTPVNHAAVAINDTAATDQDKAVVIAILANDSDIDNTTGVNAGAPKPVNTDLTARIVGQPSNGSVTVNADGTITYMPKAGYYGTDSFTYVANDGELDSAVASVTVTIRQTNHVPVAVDDSYAAIQGKAVVINPLANDSDSDGETLTSVLVAGPQHGKLTRNADGTLTYVADAGFTGTDTLTYQASDGKSLSNVATVRLTVSAANQAPVAVNDSVSVHNNQTATIDVLVNDRDADGDALKATVVNGPKHGSLTKNADGTFSYTADCLFTGTDTFTYVANDGKTNSNTATVTITVLGPNLPPIAFDDVVDVKENSAIRIDPTANDWDINGDDLKALLVCGPSHGNLLLNTDGTYTYTPDANWYGLDGFTYQAYDGQFRSNPAMVWIRVAHVNQAPVASADAFTVRAGQATRLDVIANDSDVDGDSITSKLSSSPKNGTLTRNRDGSFSYTAKSGFVGTDTFTYAATDGAVDSKPITVTITVLAPNHAPIAKDDKVTTNVGTAVRIDVLANDTDADGDRLSALLVCAPCHGKLTINTDGSYTYTPDKGWYGTDSFSYRATDDDAQSSVAMVSIAVQKINHAPTAQNASFQVQKDGSVRIDFDCLVDDPDGDALTLSLGNPSKGSLTRNRDGSYTYRPKSGFTGTDAFVYSVSDGQLSDTATIALVVSKTPPCGNAMSILFGASASAGGAESGGYIVVNLGAYTLPVIDWSTPPASNDTAASNDWWAGFSSGPLSGANLLAAQTGLAVRRD